MWLETYGFDKTEGMLQFFLTARPTTIRVTKELPQSIAIEDLVKELKKAGAEVKTNPLLPYALELEKTDNILYLPGFMEGQYTVQDASSMLVTEIADPQPGQTVVDVCAAPGGKSLHAAERVGVEGKVISRDVSEHKCDYIRENAQRLGLTNIEPQVHDARIHDESLKETADVLYLDVPCSGLGIIGRKNDIKLNVKPSGLEELTHLQWEIVKASWDYVKVGGYLIYSTCTVNRAENEDMVKRICDELPFEPVDITDKLPKELMDTREITGSSKGQVDAAPGSAGQIQLIPGEHGTDGFFIAKLRRIG